MALFVYRSRIGLGLFVSRKSMKTQESGQEGTPGFTWEQVQAVLSKIINLTQKFLWDVGRSAYCISVPYFLQYVSAERAFPVYYRNS